MWSELQDYRFVSIQGFKCLNDVINRMDFWRILTYNKYTVKIICDSFIHFRKQYLKYTDK